MTDPKASVPKFASFRPKPSSAVPTDNTRENEQSESHKNKLYTREQESSKSHRKRHRSRSRERHGSEIRERHRSRSRERHRAGSKGRSQRRDTARELARPQPEQRDAASDIYVVDRKGDTKNLVYGSIHRYDVPPFHRIGAGCVLGVPPDTKIDRSYGDDKGLVLTNLRDPKSQPREKYIFSKVGRDRPRLLRIRPEALAEESFLNDADFVPLQITRGKKRKRSDKTAGSSSESEQDETHYRSIEGKAKAPAKPVDDAFEYASESASSGSETGRVLKLESAVKQKNIELSRRIDQSPDDIEAWLALIEHQDTLLRAGDDRRHITNAEIRSTADIKIHMYEKALAKAQTLQDRERLLLGLMTEGAKIWDIKVRSDRWTKIAKDNIDSLVLWKNYLNFRQSSFSTFQYDDVREVFITRITSLKQTINKASSLQIQPLYEQLLYVLLRFTVFVRESGFVELAVAVWQSLLELNFYGRNTSLSPDEAVKPFGEFWESEVPRIGETGSLGWHKFLETGDDSTVPEGQTDEPEMPLKGDDVFASWVTAERSRAKASRLPARTLDDTVEDDPYRVILFSDIEEFLLMLPRENDSLRKSLVDAFLIFCHLPSMADHNETKSFNWSADPWLNNELLDYSSKWINENYLAERSDDTIDDQNTQPSPKSIFTTPLSNFIMAPESMFTKTWFQSFQPWREIYGHEDEGPIPYSWVRNTFKQLTQIYPDDDFMEYYLAFEWCNEPDGIKKVAKALLKQHPSNLRLYNAYAMIEWSRGNKDISSSIYSAALSMTKTMSAEDAKDSVYLWKSLVWANLETGDKDTALRYLLSIPDGTPDPTISASPAAILRTQRHLTSVRDSFLYSKHLLHAVLYTELLALLAYLSSSPSPTEPEPHSPSQGHLLPALQIFNSFFSSLPSTSSSPHLSPSPSPHPLTLHQQSLTRLLHHHTQHGPYRPSLMHTHLHTSLSLSPSNTIFFTLFTALSPPNIISPISLSTIFTDLLSPSPPSHAHTPPHTTHLQILHHHLQHSPSISAGRNAAAGIFKSVLQTNPSSDLTSSPALWKLYLLFLARYPEYLPSSSSSSSSSSLVGKSSTSLRKAGQEQEYEKKGKLLGVLKSAITRVPWCKAIYVGGVEGVVGDCSGDVGGDGKGSGGKVRERKGREKAVEKWEGRGKERDEGMERELKEVWRVMGEKGVRVHVDLEDVWDEDR
ncbi:duf1740 domain containing protein [Rutstroemia sp. NJR-2017a BVV2]|nr:duf1740 domain containing protein [Rutstroemia sp. NJR-2017a BVV2]